MVSKTDEQYNRKKKLAKSRRFMSRCAMCRTIFSRSGGFTFHHIYYETGIDKPKKSFTSGENAHQNNLAYQSHILDEVERNHTKFRLLCSKHHHMVSFGIRLRQDNWNRFKNIVSESRKHQSH